MNIDERLRESLQDNASNAPAGVSLWEGVQARSRRLDRRRHALTGAALTATAVATGLVIGLPALVREPASSPSPSTAASRLAPLSYTIPDFPYSPGWLPPGFGEPRVFLYSGAHQVNYYGERGTLVIRVSNERQTPDQQPIPLTENKTTVDGRPATIWAGENSEYGRRVYVTWQRDNRWVTVLGHPRLTVAEVMNVANGLIDRPMVFPVPFKITLAPAGFTQLGMSDRAFNERMLCVVSPHSKNPPRVETPPQDREPSDQMCVWLGKKVTPPASWTPPPYSPGGWGPLGTRRVSVDLNDGRTIVVSTTLPPERLSNDDMREVATTLVLS